jgi:peptidoglycan/LPS O-acetylase OafA/YrhL
VRYNNLQIVRALTAIAVVLYHLAVYAKIRFGVVDGPAEWFVMPWISSGLVPLFFAMSGFVLSLTLQRTPPGRYLLLRALRLYPGFWLAVLLVTAVHLVGLWPGDVMRLSDPAPNVRTFTLIATGRGGPGQYPLMVEWTLIYEVFLSLALLVLYVAAGRRRMPWVVAAWLVVLVAKSVLWGDYGSRQMPVWRSIWASVHIAPFLLGSLAFHLRDRARNLRWPVLALVVAITVSCGSWPEVVRNEAFWWLRGLAAALLVWFLVQIRDLSNRNPMVVGGAYSYGLYLVHVPLLPLAMGAMKTLGAGYGTWGGVFVAGAVALVVGTAFGWVEAGLYGRVRRLADLKKKRPERKPAACEPVAVS